MVTKAGQKCFDLRQEATNRPPVNQIYSKFPTNSKRVSTVRSFRRWPNLGIARAASLRIAYRAVPRGIGMGRRDLDSGEEMFQNRWNSTKTSWLWELKMQHQCWFKVKIRPYFQTITNQFRSSRSLLSNNSIRERLQRLDTPLQKAKQLNKQTIGIKWNQIRFKLTNWTCNLWLKIRIL